MKESVWKSGLIPESHDEFFEGFCDFYRCMTEYCAIEEFFTAEFMFGEMFALIITAVILAILPTYMDWRARCGL